MSRLLAVAFLAGIAVLVSGCFVGHRSVEGDTDGDFMLDAVELEGYNLTLQLVPATCFSDEPPRVQQIHVTSNIYESDSDFDGIEDPDEGLWGGNPQSKDTDGDGLDDRRERDLNNDQSRVAIIGSLKLTSVDSDNDCIRDGDEVNGTDVPGIGVKQTDPGAKDTDHDGFLDPFEVYRSHTDPTNPDTDGDGARELLDVDPLHDVIVDVVFQRLLLKGSTAKADVRFDYTFQTPAGARSQPESVRTFQASEGQSTPVPAEQSPGRVDVEDGTGSTRVHFQFFAIRDGTRDIDFALGEDRVMTIELDPVAKTWTGGGTQGVADGSVIVLETDEARLEMQIIVRSG